MNFLQRSLLTLIVAAAFGASAQTGAAETPHQNKCIIPVPRDGKWTNRYELLNQRAKEAGDKARVLFVGDSITQGWEGGGKEVWEHYYAPRQAVNIGISGDRTEHVLWRLDHGNVDTLKPRVAVLLIGVNNVPDESNTTSDILAGVKAVVKNWKTKLPETKILVLGIFPFRKDFDPARGRVCQINQALNHIDDGKRVFFLDFGYKLMEPDGTISKSIMPDALHPNKAGYEIWARAIEPKLAALLGESGLHPHDLVAAIDVDHLPGDRRGAVAGEESAGRAEFLRQHVALERRVRFVMLQHVGETGDAARGQRVHRAGADAVHADFFRTQIVGEIARAGFERRLGHAHDVVMRHDFFRRRNNSWPRCCRLRSSAARRRAPARPANRRYIMRDAERFPAGVHEFAFQRVLRRKRDGVQQQMQLAEFLADVLENTGDVLVLGDVARQDQRVGAERAGEFLDVFLQAFALVSEGELRAGLMPRLGDGPRDGAFVGDAEDDSEFAV